MSDVSTEPEHHLIVEADADDPDLPPVEPSLPPREWMKENLFYSVGSTILTIVFGLVAIAAYRAILNFAFHNPERNWKAVPTNIRLMMTQSYPESQYVRIWVSLGVLLALAGLTLGVGRSRPLIALRKILTTMFGIGAVSVLSAFIIKNPIRTDENGEFLRDDEAELLRESYGDALAGRWWVFLLGFLLMAVAGTIWVALGDRRRFIFLPFLGFLYSIMGLVVLSLWVVPYGNYGLLPTGEFVAEKGVTVARSTQGPWTVMWLLLGVAFVAGRSLPSIRALRVGLYLAWLLSPYFIIFVILRDPALDYDHVISTDIPMFLAFAILGGGVLWFLTRPGLGEVGRIIPLGLLLLAGFNWLAAFFGWYPMLQKARISFLVLALFALIASNFAGEYKVRRGFALSWVGAMAVLHYLITMVNTPSTLEGIQSDSFIGGFMMTLTLAVMSLTLSFPIGVLLALARTSKLPIFRLLSTTFIEVSRGVPLITVLFLFATIIPLFLPAEMGSPAKLAMAIVALTLFSSAYLAENIRGGLQSVRRGQFEAADAMGLSAAQRIGLIVLPQGLRVSIPPLVGQAIATYKETSLIAIIGLFDFLLIANRIIPAQAAFIGKRFEALIFVSLVYWVGAYSMSRYSRSLEKRLGVGER